jgi:chromosome segregation ATPase
VIKAQTMSMFNFDGQIVASAIHAQQAGDLFGDILRSRRENQNALTAAQLQDAYFALQQHYDQLVVRYNSLADRHNTVLADNKRIDAAHADALAEKDRQIAQLQAEKAHIAAEREDFRRIGQTAYRQLDAAEEEVRRLKIKSGELPPDA